MLCVEGYSYWLIDYIDVWSLISMLKIEDTWKDQKTSHFTIENQNIVRGYSGIFCFFDNPKIEVLITIGQCFYDMYDFSNFKRGL